MAIRTHNLALCHLRQDPRPVGNEVHKSADVQLLVAQMVELEHDRVILAAINAGMFEEILNDSPPILVLQSLRSTPDAVATVLRMRRVVRLCDFAIAIAAVVLQPVLPRAVPVELRHGFCGPAS